jgi:dynein light chain Tctex-type 1
MNEQFQPFKCIASCLVVSKGAGGVQALTVCIWDEQNDGFVTGQRSNETMWGIVTVRRFVG